MHIQMKWSEHRQMWVGQAKQRPTTKSHWSSLLSLFQPTQPVIRPRRPMPARVWQSAKIA